MPTLILLFLLLPGLLHRFAYNGRFAKSLAESFPGFTVETLLVVCTAAAHHAVAIAAIQFFLADITGKRVDLDAAVYLLGGHYADPRYKEALSSIANYPGWVTTYLFALLAFGIYTGRRLRKLVRYRRLDIKYSWLRYENYWHYLFSGEVLEFPEERDVPALWGVQLDPAKQISGTIISLVQDTEAGPYLYVGILADYVFDNSGALDQIILENTHRRPLGNDALDMAQDERTPSTPVGVRAALTRYYKIDGDYQVFKYSEIKNLNVKYLFVAAPASPTTASTRQAGLNPDLEAPAVVRAR